MLFRSKTYEEINQYLSAYNLFSFHHRVIYRTTCFLHQTVFNPKSSITIKNWLKPAILFNNTYDLRSNNKPIFTTSRISTCYGDSTFQNWFSKLLNKINFSNRETEFIKFRKNLATSELNNVLTVFLRLFPKFNISLDYYFYRFP